MIKGVRPRRKALPKRPFRRRREFYRKSPELRSGPCVTIYDAERGIGRIPRNLITEVGCGGAGGTTG